MKNRSKYLPTKDRWITPATAHWLFIVFGFVTIFMPLIVHEKSGSCTWLCTYLMHFGEYNPFRTVDIPHFYIDLRYDRFEVWEFYAIIQALGFSILLVWEPEAKNIDRTFIGVYVTILMVCIVALALLGIEVISPYRVAVLIILAFFGFGDWYMWSKTKTAHPENNVYKLLCFYVDIPILLSVLILTGYVMLRDERRYHETYSSFYSGAIAFQIILANFLIFLIRSHERIQKEQSFWKSVWLILTPPEENKNDGNPNEQPGVSGHA